jgi:hypothetical protein
MRKTLLGLAAFAALATPLALYAGPANAADAPTLDGPGYVSHTAGCTPNVTKHTVYKWIPDVNGSGNTQWTVNNFTDGYKASFPGKTGALVGYHRDGDKSSQAFDQTCGVSGSVLAQGSADACSVTFPLVQGVETTLYGVNGHAEVPITGDVTVTGSLDGSMDTAPQFWIGYKAKPGYVLENLGAAPTHIDFYNGDYVRDCDVA